MRRRRRMVAMAGLIGMAGVAVGQTHKVTRPETVVRAVGVYEWTGDLAKPKGERLVPVTIFIDGHLEDAGVYLARPVPMALGVGTVYELDDAGLSKGLVDVKEARHVQIPAVADATPYDDGWFGYGSFEAPPVPKPAAVKKPTQQVAVNGKAAEMAVDPDRPSFSHRGAKAAETAAAEDNGRPLAGSPEDTKVDGGKVDEKDDPDRPTLRRRPPADPKEARKAKKEQELSSVTAPKKSLNDDPDRPTIKRGHGPAEDDLPVLTGLPADMKQMVAVSDPKRREPHPFARAWEDEAEHQAVLVKMRAVAQVALLAYGPVPPGASIMASSGTGGTPVNGSAGAASALPQSGTAAQDTSLGAPPILRRNKVSANATASEQVTVPAAAPAPALAQGGGASAAGTARTPAARRAAALRARKAAKTATSPAGPVFSGEEVRGFTLSYGGAATYVYTAHTEGDGAARRYATVVAQDDGVNGLRTVMKSVTDAAHLDRQAWMRFVDVVDADASNRASLLFELRGQTARQFALYRVLGARADSLFVGGTTQ